MIRGIPSVIKGDCETDDIMPIITIKHKCAYLQNVIQGRSASLMFEWLEITSE